MAISTAITTLMYKSTLGGTYAKLVDITGYPDLGSTPSKLDTTNLSVAKFKTNILGLQEAPDLAFEANYDETGFNTMKGLEGDPLWFQLQFGTAGADGTFSWEGQLAVYANGASVDEVRKMTIITSASTEILFA